MDGIAAVTARISEIRSLMQPPPMAAAVAPGSVPGSVSTPSTGTGSATTGSSGGSFAAALASAVAEPAGRSSAAAPGAAVTGPAGRAASTTSIAGLKATYQNGRIPADALTSIGRGGHRLAAPAAAAFARLEAAARRDGVTFGVTDSYRSFDSQVDLVRRKGLYSQGGLAAAPGTSQHGWGLAVDLDLGSRAQSWMRAHGASYGFHEDTPREPWHWAFKG